jgi:hypothetical protein
MKKGMSRDINWKTTDEDGNKYQVRVHYFGGEFKFQFKDAGASDWDYKKPICLEDLETFLDTIQRRYQRRTATHDQLLLAERLLKDFKRKHGIPL